VLLVVLRLVLEHIRAAVNHDRATGIPVMGARTLQIPPIRVGHLDGEEVATARVALETVPTLGGAQVSLALFPPHGVRPERYVVRALDLATMHEQQLPLGLANYDPIRWRELRDLLCCDAGDDRHTAEGKCRGQPPEADRSQSQIWRNQGAGFLSQRDLWRCKEGAATVDASAASLITE